MDKKLINVLLNIFKRIYFYSTCLNIDISKIDVEDHKYFLEKLEKKYKYKIKGDNFKNFVYRSFLQYKCHFYKLSLFKVIFLNFISSISLPIIFILLIINSFIINIRKSKKDFSNSLAITAIKIDKDLIPESLKEKYEVVIQDKTNFILKLKDLGYLKFLFKDFILHPYFMLKSIIKIAKYNYLLNIYDPKAVISNCEYSFTSSILTGYLNQKYVKHINIMHGDKLFNIRDSFFKFNKFFVWDQHYKKIFINMKACNKQFIIEIPPKLKYSKLLKKNFNTGNMKEIITYYLQAENKNELNNIKKNLMKLKNKYIIIIRPHPIYSNIKIVKNVFAEFKIELPQKINIYDSIKKSNYIISLYSTVLYQGYLANKRIVIDDISNYKKYSSLKKLNYIIFDRPHNLLSEMM